MNVFGCFFIVIFSFLVKFLLLSEGEGLWLNRWELGFEECDGLLRLRFCFFMLLGWRGGDMILFLLDFGLVIMINFFLFILIVVLWLFLSLLEFLDFFKSGVESFFFVLGDWRGDVGRGKLSEERIEGLEVSVEERIEDLIVGEIVENFRWIVLGIWSEF